MHPVQAERERIGLPLAIPQKSPVDRQSWSCPAYVDNYCSFARLGGVPCCQVRRKGWAVVCAAAVWVTDTDIWVTSEQGTL